MSCLCNFKIIYCCAYTVHNNSFTKPKFAALYTNLRNKMLFIIASRVIKTEFLFNRGTLIV